MEKSDKWDKKQSDGFNKAAGDKREIDLKLPPEAIRQLASCDAMRMKQLSAWDAKEARESPKVVKQRLDELVQEHKVMKHVPAWARNGQSWEAIKAKATLDVSTKYYQGRQLINARADEERGRVIDYYRRHTELAEAIERGAAAGKGPELAPSQPDLAPSLPGDAPDLVRHFNTPFDPPPPPGSGGIDR